MTALNKDFNLRVYLPVKRDVEDQKVNGKVCKYENSITKYDFFF